MAAVPRHRLFMIKVMLVLTHLYESDIHYRTRSCGFSVVFAGTNRLVLPSKAFFWGEEIPPQSHGYDFRVFVSML
jgi:hypothetical protein